MQNQLEIIKKSIVIAVDFDGTCVTHAFPEVGKDIGAVPVLKRLVAEGHKLILWTMRGNVSNNTGHSGDPPVILNGDFLDAAIGWFKANGIELWGIQTNPEQSAWTTSPKAYAQIYIDDAALGAPVKHDTTLSERPFIDWHAVEVILMMDGVLESQGPHGGFIDAMREDMKVNGQIKE